MPNSTEILIYKTGIDIGSTTAKIVVLNSENKIVFSEYKRHNTQIYETISSILNKSLNKLGDFQTHFSITGSAGIGVSEKSGLPFIQEVIATTEVVNKKYPDVRTLIDIGGEDSKMIFFYDEKPPDIRMNGSCAGGTGAFIDQTASLLNVSLEEFNTLASKYSKIYPVASRCGVFAKTDIQNLLSRKISKEDIAASVFHAVAIQAMNTLARGHEIVPKVMFAGGPFSFMPELITTFIKDLILSRNDVVLSEIPTLMPALGAALNDENTDKPQKISQVLRKIFSKKKDAVKQSDRLKPVFDSIKNYDKWISEKTKHTIKRTNLSDYTDKETFLGIDSGSTTCKITLIGKNNELLYDYYENNKGKSIEAVKNGLELLSKKIDQAGNTNHIKIVRTGVTGYGEDLIKSAFGIDTGIVETIAHYEAAKYFNKDVSFIMDIGGQDMKAIFIKNGAIDRIELNEACSSGCGSFIQTFGTSLGHSVEDFAKLACSADAPCDLGTRCTVFMNSKVKQSLRENASVNNIAAGLSISVIKNALFKVLQIKDIEVLGENIVVQGGTFKNASVLKALEDHIGRKVICSDIPEQMGAFGIALYIKTEYYNKEKKEETSFIGFENISKTNDFRTKNLLCKGCENVCTVTQFIFSDNRKFYSGNKCEKIFSNKGNNRQKGINLFEEKNELLFNRPNKKTEKIKQRIGIPRVLNIYENYPFWNTVLIECGFETILSDLSTMPLYETGKGTVMSDSICFPAKLAHGHIYNLIEKRVDRIFYPIVMYEKNEFANAENSFNCPIVSSYAEVISSSINPEKNCEIPIDSPIFNLNDNKLLKKALYLYLKKLGVSKIVFKNAFEKGFNEYNKYREKLLRRGKEIINKAIADKSTLIVLAGRPYHTDSLINHKTPDILTAWGIDVISEDMIPYPKDNKLDDLQIISQWSYPNRIYNAAQWVAEQDNNIQFVQINSFGCGPDAIIIDECSEILKARGKNHTLIRVDEITNTGSVKLRLRSMLETLKLDNNKLKLNNKRISTAIFNKEDKRRTILIPHFADFYSDLIPVFFNLAGFNMINLPKPTKKSVDYGLKYSNNEICYPATVIVGDILKFLKEEKYDRNEIAIGISQTGGQCRASTYLSLIKKGMAAAGYNDIPVVTAGTAGKTINPQPGFDVNWKKILPAVFVAMLFSDSLSKMYNALVVREKNKGDTKKITQKYIEKVKPLILSEDTKGMYVLLKEAVTDFNSIEINSGYYPKIGLVGEIYIKYNSFGHAYITDWLNKQGIEVVIPPIVDFFTQEFINISYNRKNKLSKISISDIYVYFLEKLSEIHIRRANKIIKEFRFYTPFCKIRHEARNASEIINLANQFGEGWLIPAEISSFAKQGINNVVSVQPFGCIANHIVSKGVEKRIKDMFPKLNLLFLDFDDGTSEVNILNRLHFMVRNCQN
ncbi:MAG: acyl-CoA dehydratase activase [Bacteroidales bacterium]|nr:acyl-CoA dehydratase activase [Bacteroidales bacterium]